MVSAAMTATKLEEIMRSELGRIMAPFMRNIARPHERNNCLR
jgi:hypothetical protein